MYPGGLPSERLEGKIGVHVALHAHPGMESAGFPKMNPLSLLQWAIADIRGDGLKNLDFTPTYPAGNIWAQPIDKATSVLVFYSIVVCSALLIALIRAKVSGPRLAALATGAVVAVPCFIVLFYMAMIFANAHNNDWRTLDIKVLGWGLLALPPGAAILMYAHKRGGGMRGLAVSIATGLVAFPTSLVAFLRSMRRWGVEGETEPSKDEKTPAER